MRGFDSGEDTNVVQKGFARTSDEEQYRSSASRQVIEYRVERGGHNRIGQLGQPPDISAYGIYHTTQQSRADSPETYRRG